MQRKMERAFIGDNVEVAGPIERWTFGVSATYGRGVAGGVSVLVEGEGQVVGVVVTGGSVLLEKVVDGSEIVMVIGLALLVLMAPPS